MVKNKKQRPIMHMETVKQALAHIERNPLGKVLHLKAKKCDNPEAVRAMINEINAAVPSAVIMRISGVLDDIIWHYRSGLRFPDVARLVALYKAAHLIFTALDTGRVDDLVKLPAAKRLRGKRVQLRDIDLRIPGENPEESQSDGPAAGIGANLRVETAGTEKLVLPPNILGAHFSALRGSADALREMVQFGQVDLQDADRNQLATIVIGLMRLGKLDATIFERALHGQPLSGNDRQMAKLFSVFGGPKRRAR